MPGLAEPVGERATQINLVLSVCSKLQPSYDADLSPVPAHYENRHQTMLRRDTPMSVAWRTEQPR